MESGKLKKICSIALAAGIFIFCSSCNMSMSFWNPYCITNTYVSVGTEEGVYNLAGAYIDVLNNSDKVILSGDVSFMIFDSEGRQVGIPSKVSASVDLGIMPGEESEVIISLDKVLGANLEGPYKLDFVHFTKLNYEDGTVWVDPLGVTAGW